MCYKEVVTPYAGVLNSKLKRLRIKGYIYTYTHRRTLASIHNGYSQY